jgi:hypothetical protein
MTVSTTKIRSRGGRTPIAFNPASTALGGRHEISPRRQFLHMAVGAAAVPAVSRIAWAQTYPVRPITLVVPYAAGGPADVIARVLAERMRASLGQPLLIENVVGAGGTIALGRVARAAPDGYTILIGNLGSNVFLGATYRLGYDLVTDFSPVAQARKSSPTRPDCHSQERSYVVPQLRSSFQGHEAAPARRNPS